MTDKAISSLRRRVIEDMTIRRLSPKMHYQYIRHVKKFADFLGRLPTRPPQRMSIAISCGWRRSGRRYRPSMSVPRPCGSSSGSR